MFCNKKKFSLYNKENTSQKIHSVSQFLCNVCVCGLCVCALNFGCGNDKFVSSVFGVFVEKLLLCVLFSKNNLFVDLVSRYTHTPVTTVSLILLKRIVTSQDYFCSPQCKADVEWVWRRFIIIISPAFIPTLPHLTQSFI